MYFGAEVLQAQPLSCGDVEGAAGGVDQPAVVHSCLHPPVLVLPLPLLPPGLLQLPAQLQHQCVGHHVSRVPPGGPVVGLTPVKPRGHLLVYLTAWAGRKQLKRTLLHLDTQRYDSDLKEDICFQVENATQGL